MKDYLDQVKGSIEKKLSTEVPFDSRTKFKIMSKIEKHERRNSKQHLMPRILSTVVVASIALFLTGYTYQQLVNPSLIQNVRSGSEVKNFSSFEDTSYGFSIQIPDYLKNHLETSESSNGIQFTFTYEKGGDTYRVPLFYVDVYKKDAGESAIPYLDKLAETDKYIYFASQLEANYDLAEFKKHNNVEALKLFENDFNSILGSFQPAAVEDFAHDVITVNEKLKEIDQAKSIAQNLVNIEYTTDNLDSFLQVTKGQNMKDAMIEKFLYRQKAKKRYEIVEISPIYVRNEELKAKIVINHYPTNNTPKEGIEEYDLSPYQATYIGTYGLIDREWTKTEWQGISTEPINFE